MLVLRRDRVGHQHFTAPRFLPFVGAAVGLVFLLPIDRTAEIYRTAVLLLLGGLALWASTSSSPGAPAPWSPSRT